MDKECTLTPHELKILLCVFVGQSLDDTGINNTPATNGAINRLIDIGAIQANLSSVTKKGEVWVIDILSTPPPVEIIRDSRGREHGGGNE